MQNFLDTYKILNQENLHLLESIYTDDAIFSDPVHEIHGLQDIKLYFSTLYQNISSIEFFFEHKLKNDNKAYVQWSMKFSHLKLNKGKTITVSGMTFLRFAPSGKVFYHKDQFDLGYMIYEHLPVLGRLLTAIKKRMGT